MKASRPKGAGSRHPALRRATGTRTGRGQRGKRMDAAQGWGGEPQLPPINCSVRFQGWCQVKEVGKGSPSFAIDE
ncbi:hypothetical protein CCMA1212_010537 [Trichoderma ghanense]|uniref:Uncharacterized protein n=1 Tax=Trichoderma ghanense TaxID=65468 RepID=A0ABY2GPF1_9HYPO